MSFALHREGLRETVSPDSWQSGGLLHAQSLGNFFAAGPAISLPIFTGGRIRSNVAVQKARWKQTQILYQSTVLNSLEETENALVNYSQEQERRDRLQAAVSQNQTALELSRELYTSGLGDFLAVLDAQRQLYGNEDLLAQSQTAVATNLIALYKALGGGWESISPTIKTSVHESASGLLGPTPSSSTWTCKKDC